jgi:Tfp pilus assembly protein PilO
MSRTARIVAALAGAAVVLAALGWLVLVAPARHREQRLDAGIASAQQELATLELAATTQKSGSAAELFDLSRAMPAGDDQAGTLLDLDRNARAAGVGLVSVVPSAQLSLADGSAALPLTVVVNGSYAQVAAFLRRLRLQVRAGATQVFSTGRLFDVDEVTIAADKGARVSATLALAAFAYGPPPAAAPSVSAVPADGAEAAGGRG